MLALTSLFLATAFAQTGWKEFTSTEGNFRVLFPEDPQQQTLSERNLHEVSAAAGSESYGLAYADYPRGTDCENVLNAERDLILDGLGGPVVDEQRISAVRQPG